jgi:hypothetical protein
VVLGGCATQSGSKAASARGNALRTAPSPAPPPVITRAGAQQVLAVYTSANNRANKLRSDSLLRGIEANSSYQMDAGNYRWTRVTDPANHGYIPSAFARPEFLLPRQSGAPWFVVRATWTNVNDPAASPTPQYLLFTRVSSAARWLQVQEPFALAGNAPAPRVATDAQGYASVISQADAARLAVPPDQIQSLTAGYLDGRHGGQLQFTGAGSLADEKDQAFWQAHLPAGSTDTDQHAATADQAFALRTTGGGALVFYDISARLTLAAPGGQSMRIEIPGFYSGGVVNSAEVSYVEQFAAFDPPRGQGSPRVVADNSGIASLG